MQLPTQVSPPDFLLSDHAPSRLPEHLSRTTVVAVPVLRGEEGPSLGPGAAELADVEDEDEEGVGLVFTEPDVAFSLAARDAAAVVVRVHLSLGARPPWLRGTGGPGPFEHHVELRVTLDALTVAEASWEQELVAFPVR